MSELGVLEFGGFRFDSDTPVLWRGSEVVPLTPKALELLRALVERSGDVVSKAELMRRVWPDTVVEEGNLTVLVAALRRGVDPRPDGGSYIQTLPRRGYRFVAPLRGPRGIRAPAVAVLPFESLGSEVEPGLGPALAEATIGRLAAEEGILVRPALAVAHCAGAPEAGRDLARALGVDAVVTGTVQRHGTRVRVAVQLVPRTRGAGVWARTVEASGIDLFSLQDEVADALVRLLRPRLLGGHAPTRVEQGWRAGAREAYLRGRFFWARFTPHGVGQAFAQFGEAVALDPAQAAPYSGLADCHLLLGVGGLCQPLAAWDRALECAARALDRDPGHPEAHAARAYARLFRDHDWTAARSDLDHAVARAGPSPSAYLWRALFRALGGDFEAARRDLGRSRDIDALSIVGSAFQCFVHEVTGEHEEALSAARQAAELRPDSFFGYRCLGLASVRLGRTEAGLRALRRAVELTAGGPVMRAILAWALATTGAVEEARRELKALDRTSDTTFISPCARAAVLLALGDRHAALERLEEGTAQREALAVFLAVDPAFAGLRGDPRFRRLLRRIGCAGAQDQGGPDAPDVEAPPKPKTTVSGP
jgi:DNA-binding winged helix-turn-helix (wHTH) protein/TolB-like protein/Flp pilus assembly protein TadD